MRLISNINDLIALVLLIAIIPGLWVADGLQMLDLSAEVLGATIAAWTIVLQYYFRKKKSEDSSER